MSNLPQEALQEAVRWTIRLRHATVADWEKFTEWLEADPGHLAAYDSVAAADQVLDELPKQAERLVVETSAEPDALGRRTVIAWAVAASLLGVIGYTSFGGSSDPYALETLPGQRRSIALDDGSKIEMNGASRIVLDRENQRFARLDRGEALFKVVHDQSSSFRVEAGDAVIEDLGTVFNVVRAKELVAVEVAEGAVIVTAGGERAHLSPGMTLQARNDRLALGRRDPASVGEWQHRLLSYSSANFDDIAGDLLRNTGIKIRVSPELRERRFSGVIMLGGSEREIVRRISGLLMVEARPNGEEWLLLPSRL